MYHFALRCGYVISYALRHLGNRTIQVKGALTGCD